MRSDRRHTPAYGLPVRRHQLTKRRRRRIARRQQQQRTINWSGVTSLITAFTAVGALIFTALSLNATRDQVAVAQQGQFTERYSRAIEQLGRQGPDQLQIRLGAIYALERLASDSPRDQPTIVEVLATFIRTSVATANTSLEYPEWRMEVEAEVDDAESKAYTVTYRQNDTSTPTSPGQFGGFCPSNVPRSPSPDVQAALTVLGRRDTTQDNHTVVDLSRTCLRGANLAHANLTNANLSGTDLGAAELTNVNLSDANLSGAFLGCVTTIYPDTVEYCNELMHISGANFSGANLDAAYFGNAHLNDVDFSEASLRSTILVGANTGLYIPGTDLNDTNFPTINFHNADLDGADLRLAEFAKGDFTGAGFLNAKLTGANLPYANLSGAHLVAADLTAADLSRANLTNTDLGKAILNGADLTGAEHNSGTVVLKVETDGYTKGRWW